MTNDTPVEVISYVDVAQYNPLNAMDYIFTAGADTGETQFFNYVVLGFSYLTRNSRGYTQVELSPPLQYLLNNSKTYIKPLQEKGIRVLIEVRSGTFADTAEGLDLGLGTMDMAAINPFIEELKRLINQYGFDGFEFNDVGGGKKAYPPLTRNLTKFKSAEPLYDEEKRKELFKDEEGNPLSKETIEANLWIEGGSNFSNLIQKTNEILKETYTSSYTNGSASKLDTDTKTVDRVILVRKVGHGAHLLSQLRMEYMPDAYSGADPKVTGNLKYIINAVPYDTKNPHAYLLDEEGQGRDVGPDSDDRYAPFTIDLLNKKTAAEAENLAEFFLYQEGDPTNENRYGVLYFTGLRSGSEDPSLTDYMSYFSEKLFGRRVSLSEQPGAGDYKKTW
jgi:hypothetical protein